MRRTMMHECVHLYNASIPQKGNPLCGSKAVIDAEEERELQYRKKATPFAACTEVSFYG